MSKNNEVKAAIIHALNSDRFNKSGVGRIGGERHGYELNRTFLQAFLTNKRPPSQMPDEMAWALLKGMGPVYIGPRILAYDACDPDKQAPLIIGPSLLSWDGQDLVRLKVQEATKITKLDEI